MSQMDSSSSTTSIFILISDYLCDDCLFLYSTELAYNSAKQQNASRRNNIADSKADITSAGNLYANILRISGIGISPFVNKH